MGPHDEPGDRGLSGAGNAGVPDGAAKHVGDDVRAYRQARHECDCAVHQRLARRRRRRLVDRHHTALDAWPTQVAPPVTLAQLASRVNVFRAFAL
jgi:hypothetical protein